MVIHIDIAVANNRVYLGQRADWICWTNIQMFVRANPYATEFVILGFYPEVVAASFDWVPKFKATIFVGFLAHDKDHLACRHATTKHDV